MLLNSNGSTLKYIMSRTNWKYVVHVNFTLLHITCAEDPRYNDSVCYQRFCCQIEFAVIKKLDMDPSKAWITDTFEQFLFINHTLSVFVRIAPTRRFLQICQTYNFLKNNMGLSMKKYTVRWFLCRLNWRCNKFCCYNECRYKEGSLYRPIMPIALHSRCPEIHSEINLIEIQNWKPRTKHSDCTTLQRLKYP